MQLVDNISKIISRVSNSNGNNNAKKINKIVKFGLLYSREG